MDINLVVDFIQGVGFPIAACVAMYINNNRQNQQHAQEVSSLRTTIEQNTIVIQRLVDKME